MKLDITGPLVHLIRKLSIHIKMFGAENLFPSWHETIPVCGKWHSEHWRINLQLWAARQAGSHVSLQMVPPGKILSPETKLQMCLQLSPSFPHLHEPAVDPEVGHTNTTQSGVSTSWTCCSESYPDQSLRQRALRLVNFLKDLLKISLFRYFHRSFLEVEIKFVHCLFACIAQEFHTVYHIKLLIKCKKCCSTNTGCRRLGLKML